MIPYRMNQMGISLPYKRKLQYLESTGTQYLLINKTITQDSNIEVKFQGAETDPDEMPLIYGCSTAIPYLWAGKGSQGNWKIIVAYGRQYPPILATLTRDLYNYEPHIIGNRGNIAFFDNVDTAISTSSFSYSRICFFGCDDRNGPNPSILGRTRIFYIKCDGLDLIPVLDRSGVPCMYDKGTNQFFYNSGSGQFNYA